MFFRKWFGVATITVSMIIFNGNGDEVTQAMKVGGSKQVNECVSAPCLNGGRCCEGVNSYTCTCEPGFTGQQCQTNINECSSVPCMNGGSCIDGVNAYTCTCAPGFTGQQCQTNINECSSVPCMNGGSCIDGVNTYTCTCAPGFTGQQCQTNTIGDFILRNTAAGSDSYFFNRTWSDYKQGFGTTDSLFWIGLDRLHDLSQRGCAVRFDLQAVNGTWYYAQYSKFVVGGPADDYRLSLGGYTGNIYDSMSYFHNNMPFSTYDYGDTRGCATTWYGGWWYYNCCYACLTITPTIRWYTSESARTVLILNAVDIRFTCRWTTM